MKAKRNTQQQKQQFVKASITGDFFVGYIQGKENEVIKRIKFIIFNEKFESSKEIMLCVILLKYSIVLFITSS